MILWTIQHYLAYEKLLETGFLTANENYLICEDNFKFAYDWIARRMQEHGLNAPEGIKYPIWAWYQWEGKRKRRDMRESGYARRGEKIVQLTINIPDNDIMLSDFELFHYVLNYWYLPIDDADGDTFEEEYKALGYSWNDLSDFSIHTKEMDAIREKIQKSWERIFILERINENIICGLDYEKCIQATFWKLKKEQVTRAEIFIAK
ncbi:DUF3841 domain-containing protein [Anaerosporobacter sp.]|uniref:DUF3841 domain-containing protein n=1 Tax=Anaerosporobacter sp. TaxID=1872529 RepID=UPI00286EB6D5|nr:DUF3841 domain-containing protein [Anaerosporobacter sp.]